MVWVTHESGWEIEISREASEDPEKLAKVIALLQQISEM